MNSLTKIALTTACVFTLSSAFAATPAKSEKHAKHVTKMAHSVHNLMADNLKPLGGMAKGKIPLNVEVVKTNAQRISYLSTMIPHYFNTNPAPYKVNTEAKPALFENGSDIEKRANKLHKDAENLVKVSSAGNEMAIKKAIGAVAKNCGGCHDEYKNK